MPTRPRSQASSLLVLIAIGAILGAPAGSALRAQAAPPSPSGFAVFLGAGVSELSGGASKGSVGAYAFGIAHERWLRERLSWHTELLMETDGTDLGKTSIFSLPTSISQVHVGLAGMLRWNRPSGGYLAAGGSVMLETSCDVDVKGGPGFLGGETVSCDAFTDIPLESHSATAGLLVAAGIQRSRLGLEARLQQGLNASVEASSGKMIPRRLSVVLSYRLGSRR